MAIDVFLSRKSQDNYLARQIFDFLINKGLSVFDSDELSKSGNSDYRKEIDKALDETTHMIVIGSSIENIISSWVEAEWGFFLGEKRASRKSGNLITIIDPKIQIKELPPGLRNLEVIPFSETHFEKIYAYVSLEHKSRQAIKKVEIDQVSDFIIKSDKYARLNPDKLRPMALQNRFAHQFTYRLNVKWNPRTSVPYFTHESWSKNLRQLPDQSDTYPWLTVSDFLEPYLIQLPYSMNRDRFFDGNLPPSVVDNGYLLPLKSDFFDFFDIEDLQSRRVRLKMIPQAGGINVTLDIPILATSQQNNQFVTFKRLYVQTLDNKTSKPNEAANEGFIINSKFTVNIYPIIRSGSVPVSADFRVEFIESGFDNQKQFELAYFWQPTNEPVPFESKHQRTVRQQSTDGSSVIYVLREEFDYIQIHIRDDRQELRGLLIPNWIKYNGGDKQFKFSIDFNPTFTHIEYCIDGNPPSPFKVGKPIPQVASLIVPEHYNPSQFELFLLYDLEFVPSIIGPGSENSFPVSTAIAEPMNLNFNQQTEPLADFNIPFYVEQLPAGSNRITTNLKWAKTRDKNELRAQAFLEELFMLIRNKVLLEGGDLYRTKIYWLHSSYITLSRMSQLRSNWQSLYDHYINESPKMLEAILKSVAAYYYYYQHPALSASYQTVVNIDISDNISEVVIFEHDTLKLLTSFQFGSNAIYGDAFSEYGAASHNGFVRKYADKIQNLLESQSLGNLSDNNRRILDTNRSEDIIAFWFSIERKLNDLKIINMLSFYGMLAKNEDLKVVFVLFFTALLYHIAKLMKLKNINLPGAITFSNTGSKLLSIISSEDQMLSKLARVIFEKVYEKTYDSNGLTLFYERKGPKEVACKGALMQPANNRPLDTENISYIYSATFNDEYPALTYDDLRKPEVIDSLLKETNEFIDFFFAVNQQFSFVRQLNVSARSLMVAQQELRTHLDTSLMDGIEMKESNMANEYINVVDALAKPIDETLFFYPLIGAINKLTNALV